MSYWSVKIPPILNVSFLSGQVLIVVIRWAWPTFCYIHGCRQVNNQPMFYLSQGFCHCTNSLAFEKIIYEPLNFISKLKKGSFYSTFYNTKMKSYWPTIGQLNVYWPTIGNYVWILAYHWSFVLYFIGTISCFKEGQFTACLLAIRF